MRLRLARFAGLTLGLSPGWYELPSHLPVVERQRLLDLLASTLSSDPVVLECLWSDLGDLGSGFDLGTFVHVSVPASVGEIERTAAFAGLGPGLGLFTVDTPGRWPDPAWDELEVKRALAAWLRTRLGRADHPLAGQGIGELPLELLSRATCEPVELLELVETTVAFAGRQRAELGHIDWQQCAHWSIGRRLANRLGEAPAQLRPRLARTIIAAPEGELPALLDRREFDELARLGLAHVADGEGLLVPLARLAAEQQVAALIEIEGLQVAASDPKSPPRNRASNPREAVHALNPRTKVGPEDPWFVDLRAHLSWVRSFAKRFELLIGRLDAPARVAVLQQSGSGADTMVRRLLFELGHKGLITVNVTGLTPLIFDDLHIADVWLASLRSLLEWADAQPDLELAETELAKLRGWLAEFATQGDLRDYLLLGAGVAERTRAPSLVALIHRIADAQRAGPQSMGLRARTHELLLHLRRLIRELQDQLSSRGARLCLRFESLDLLVDQARVDEVFLRHGEDFESLDCHLVSSFGLAAEYFPARRAVSEVFPTLVFPEAPAEGEDEDENETLVDAARALLGARIELDGVFDDPDARIAQLVGASGGRIGWLLETLRSACIAAGMGTVEAAHVTSAIELLATSLAGAVPEGCWIRLEAVDREQMFDEADAWMLTQGLLLPRVQHQRWAVPAPLAAEPRFVAAQLMERGLTEGAIRDFRAAVDMLEAAKWTGSHEHIRALTLLGFTLTSSGAVDETRAIIDRLRGSDHGRSIAFLSAQLAEQLVSEGQHNDALEPAKEGWEGLRKSGAPSVRAMAGYAYVRALEAHGQRQKASEVMSELISLMDQLAPDDEIRTKIKTLAADLNIDVP